MHHTDRVGRALGESAARVQAICSLTANEAEAVAFRADLSDRDLIKGLHEMAARAAMWLAVALEYGEAC